jgi:hypothetical protein
MNSRLRAAPLSFPELFRGIGPRGPNPSQLLVLEDLHWADESTLTLLTHLANRIAQLGAVIIGTYRSGYSDDNLVLVRTLEELVRLGVRPLKLGGLSKEAVAQSDTRTSLLYKEGPARFWSFSQPHR